MKFYRKKQLQVGTDEGEPAPAHPPTRRRRVSESSQTVLGSQISSIHDTKETITPVLSPPSCLPTSRLFGHMPGREPSLDHHASM